MDEVVFFEDFIPTAETDADGICEHVDEYGAFSRGAGGAEDVAATTAVVPAVNEIERDGATEASLFGWFGEGNGG